MDSFFSLRLNFLQTGLVIGSISHHTVNNITFRLEELGVLCKNNLVLVMMAGTMHVQKTIYDLNLRDP